MVVPAYNGLEGLDLALQETFDVIIIHSEDTVLKAGDRLIIFSMKKAIPMAERFLAL